MIHKLGNYYFGLWTLASVFVFYIGLIEFGISSAVQRYMSVALGEKNYNKTQNVFEEVGKIVVGQDYTENEDILDVPTFLRKQMD